MGTLKDKSVSSSSNPVKLNKSLPAPKVPRRSSWRLRGTRTTSTLSSSLKNPSGSFSMERGSRSLPLKCSRDVPADFAVTSTTRTLLTSRPQEVLDVQAPLGRLQLHDRRALLPRHPQPIEAPIRARIEPMRQGNHHPHSFERLVEKLSPISQLPRPLISQHIVEKRDNQVCISVQKVKTCSKISQGESEEPRPESLRRQMVQFVCLDAPSRQAQQLEQRAKAGESLIMTFGGKPIAYSKIQYEPTVCRRQSNQI